MEQNCFRSETERVEPNNNNTDTNKFDFSVSFLSFVDKVKKVF